LPARSKASFTTLAAIGIAGALRTMHSADKSAEFAQAIPVIEASLRSDWIAAYKVRFDEP
jgi:hypothetical protein